MVCLFCTANVIIVMVTHNLIIVKKNVQIMYCDCQKDSVGTNHRMEP